MGFYIDMIDVGQGDCFLLTIDGTGILDYTILIDGGPPDAGWKVSKFVKEHANGALNAVVATHLDMDHIGGLKDVVKECAVGEVRMNLPPGESLKILSERLLDRERRGSSLELFEKSLRAANDLATALVQSGKRPRPFTAGQGWTMGDVVLNVLNPTPERLRIAWEDVEKAESQSAIALREASKSLGLSVAPPTSAENNSGIVLELVYKGQPYALFAADVGADVLKEVTKGKSYHLLKVPHHGSKTGLDKDLLKQIQPKHALLPVGENPYGHPAIEILDMLREVNCKTYCTERTPDCRRDCPDRGFGTVCWRMDRDPRPDWRPIRPEQCANNIRRGGSR